MDIKQMQYQFQMQMNQFGEALQLDSDDIEYWLNKAQLDLIKERYNGTNNQRKGFEQSQERIDDLRVLITRDTELDATYGKEFSGISGFEVDITSFPADYMFLVAQKSKVICSYPEIEWTLDGNNKRVATNGGRELIVKNRVSQSHDIYKLLSDPFNKTKGNSPISVVASNGIYVFTDKCFIVDKVIIDYLRVPTEMSIEKGTPDGDCELPSHLHKDIIQRAVDAFLNNTRELKQRLQRETPVANNQQNETEQ